jgi:hypothetical protein
MLCRISDEIVYNPWDEEPTDARNREDKEESRADEEE